MKTTSKILNSVVALILILILSQQTIQAQQLNNEDKNDVIKVLYDQEAKWNDGNISGYMEGYYQSDSLKFITKNGVTYGWENTLQKYKKSYPDKAAMGNLKFEVININALCENKAIMTGKWTLSFKGSINTKPDIVGYFTLIWQKFDGKWFIIIDHTS